jgi:hypothetical protein
VVTETLRLVNAVAASGDACLAALTGIGVVPSVMSFSRAPEYATRLEAARFLSKLCSDSGSSVRLLISCRVWLTD